MRATHKNKQMRLSKNSKPKNVILPPALIGGGNFFYLADEEQTRMSRETKLVCVKKTQTEMCPLPLY